jgi:hypothetical protein
MIRKTINCDVCAAEKLVSSNWYVAYERNGQMTLRGWDASTGSGKKLKHLCGQKCVLRLISNFTDAWQTHGLEASKEAVVETVEAAASPAMAPESMEDAAPPMAAAPVAVAAVLARPIHIDAATAAAIEAESWAGPVRFKEKENLWDLQYKAKIERESFLHASRTPAVPLNRMHKTA